MARVAVVGGGSIGVGFAIVFSRAGHTVAIQEPAADRRSALGDEIRVRLEENAEIGLLDEPPGAVLSRIEIGGSLEEAVCDADFVQECAPEKLDLKRAIFATLDRSVPRDAIIASASSAIPISRTASDLAGRARCLVAHPGNPPYLLPVIELVPATFTSRETLDRARAFYEDCGMAPALLKREVEGFVFNRLQGALLNEAYCLVRDGVADVSDIDRIVRDGLGLRWSVTGPFETVDLNTRGGIEEHASRMGPAYAHMRAERDPSQAWEPDLVADVAAQRRALLPLETWDDRVRWRDRALARLIVQRERGSADAD